MTQQYFAANPDAPSDERRFTARALGLEMNFWTDAGVFSKGELDVGTALLLRTLPELSGRVLDLGCGWGALGAFLAKKNPGADFLLTDINERAVGLATRNIRENALHNARCVVSDGFARVEGAFDAICTNPPIRAGKRVLYDLFAESLIHLAPGGELWLVIRKQQGAESALKFLHEQGTNAQRVARDAGFWIIKAGKAETT